MNSSNQSLLPFDILHSDVWTSPVLSSLGHKYYVLFLDNYSNFLWTYPISHKSQVYSCFQKLRAYINTQFQKEIKTIQCDNGREYVNNIFEKYVILMELVFVCLVIIHRRKTENLNEKYAPLTILFEHY
jgi:hypothetical protein